MSSHKLKHPFFEQKSKEDIKKVLKVVMTSDRGLCGAFNGNICRFAKDKIDSSDFEKVDLFFIGKKGYDFFKFRGYKEGELLLGLTKEISYPLSARISKELMDKVLEGSYDAVYVIYNEFKSVITPRVVMERFLPFEENKEGLSENKKNIFNKDILLEATPKELLESLLERYFSIQIYRFMCENVAAEHGSRMATMENATKNAEEVKNKLTLTYNKLRQGSITTELIEIVAGAESLN